VLLREVEIGGKKKGGKQEGSKLANNFRKREK